MFVAEVHEGMYFVQKKFTGLTHSKSKGVIKLIHFLQRDYPTPPQGATVVRFDTCTSEVKRLCDDRPESCLRRQKALAERLNVSIMKFVNRYPMYRQKYTEKAILHMRGGDAIKRNPRILTESLHAKVYLLKLLAQSGVRAAFITESQSDMEVVKQTIQPIVDRLDLDANIEFIVGGDVVTWWIEMTQAKFLILSGSTYGMSASLARVSRPTFSGNPRLLSPCMACYVDLDEIFHPTNEVGQIFYNDGYGSNNCGRWSSSVFRSLVSSLVTANESQAAS